MEAENHKQAGGTATMPLSTQELPAAARLAPGDPRAYDGGITRTAEASAPSRKGINPWLLLLIGIPALLLIAVAGTVLTGLLFVAQVSDKFEVSQVGPLVEESAVVQLGGARSVDLTLKMDTGTLNVSGGADELLAGTFRYNIDAWKPQVSYTVNRDEGALQVRQPDTLLKGGSGAEYGWDLRLKAGVPMTIQADLGAGASNFKLGGLAVGKLAIDSGVGSTTIDLAGDWKQDLDATIRGGIGDITLRLPANTGVRVVVEDGLGDVFAGGMKANGDVYTNDVYGQTDHNLDIKVETGMGTTRIEIVK